MPIQSSKQALSLRAMCESMKLNWCHQFLRPSSFVGAAIFVGEAREQGVGNWLTATRCSTLARLVGLGKGSPPTGTGSGEDGGCGLMPVRVLLASAWIFYYFGGGSGTWAQIIVSWRNLWRFLMDHAATSLHETAGRPMSGWTEIQFVAMRHKERVHSTSSLD